MDTSQVLAALGAGSVIGLVLALVGGGGSILAVPLLVYGVGVPSAHAAIGTAAVAVAANAATGLIGHAREGTVKWPCAIAFALAGVIGAAAGAELGKAMDGQQLLMLFGFLMIGVGLSMFRPRRATEAPDVHLSRSTASSLLPRLVPIGFGVGLAAGFFGIGGGFLIVPGLMAATAMPLRNAVGTSLVVVTALGITTATSYALSGFVDWRLVTLMILGGAGGAGGGIALGRHLAARKHLLERVFGVAVIGVGLCIALLAG
jgi:uncharacterized membrane protein YfcA